MLLKNAIVSKITAVFVTFMTVALNGCVWVVATEAAVGEIETVAGGSCLMELDAQPCTNKIEIDVRMKNHEPGRNSSER